MVVAVTDVRSARRVRRAGGIARLVSHSGTLLDRIFRLLSHQARIAGVAWNIDPVANKVVLTIDTTVSRHNRNRLKSLVRHFGNAIRVQSAGPITLSTSGGDAIIGDHGRCSLGFNVTRAGAPYYLTAGHCTALVPPWRDPAGTNFGSSFPGNDYGIVRYASSAAALGKVDLYNGTFQDITAAGNAYVGQTVNKSGSTSGLTGGRVTALNATVNYAQGRVTGLIRTSVCVRPGDSGGSLFAGSTALGLVSGITGDCTRSVTTYFNPVVEALQAYGAALAASSAPPPPPPPPPPPAGRVVLAQGPAAPSGYRYAITITGFAASTAVAVSCRDSVSPGGFYTFNLGTDGSGSGFTQSFCYSGDGPEHWVVADGIESNHVTWGGGTPPPPPPPPPMTWAEQETPNHPVNTFTNYHNASGMGPAIAAGQWVDVSCKVYDPTIGSVNPDGYWYRIASAPWNNAYYSPANTFMNGDPYGGPYTHNTDFNVANC
jgi:streptogrisin D